MVFNKYALGVGANDPYLQGISNKVNRDDDSSFDSLHTANDTHSNFQYNSSCYKPSLPTEADVGREFPGKKLVFDIAKFARESRKDKLTSELQFSII